MNASLLYLLPIAVTLYWVARILLSPTPRRGAKMYFIAAATVVAIGCVCNAFHQADEYKEDFGILYTSSCFMGLFAPLYFLYVRELTDRRGAKVTDYLLFIPSFVIFICYTFLWFVLPPEHEHEMVREMVFSQTGTHQHMPICSIGHATFIIYYMVPLQILATTAWSIWQKVKYSRLMGKYYSYDSSDTGVHNIATTAELEAGMGVCTFLLSVTSTLQPIHETAVYCLTLILAIVMWMIGKKTYEVGPDISLLAAKSVSQDTSQADVETEEQIVAQDETEEDMILDDEEEEYARTAAQPEEQNTPGHETNAAQFSNWASQEGREWTEEQAGSTDKVAEDDDIEVTELEEVIRDEELQRVLPKSVVDEIRDNRMYLNPNLTLISLADELGTNRTYLSQAIHYYYNTNLSGLIKQLRVEHSIQLIEATDMQSLNFQAIARDCGYTTMSTFYRDFSSLVGCTPKTFKMNG